MSSIPFHQSSYVAQVKRLRLLAEQAVLRYPIRVRHLHFIHHGENATFRVDGSKGDRYLLRLHRHDYHTKAAILEELSWLDQLASQGMRVPQPILSKNGAMLESVDHLAIGVPRLVALFKWRDGRACGEGASPKTIRDVGSLLGQLQNLAPKKAVRHRRYWTAEGLVGPSPKFGSIDQIPGATPKQQRVISAVRRRTYRRLQDFARKFPKRQSLIHADLHFGNLIRTSDGLAPIDFDDCGFGFHAYDLAVPLLWIRGSKACQTDLAFARFRAAIIEGYAQHRPWDEHDDRILSDLLIARRLTLLGWLKSRADNPRLRKVLKKYLPKTIKEIS
ncbi:MAG: phosphotransferase enzyme family protein [Bdellovibrionales bacterium]